MQAAASNSPPATFAPKAAQGLDPEGRGMAQAGVDTQEQPGGREKPTAAQPAEAVRQFTPLALQSDYLNLMGPIPFPVWLI